MLTSASEIISLSNSSWLIQILQDPNEVPSLLKILCIAFLPFYLYILVLYLSPFFFFISMAALVIQTFHHTV